MKLIKINYVKFKNRVNNGGDSVINCILNDGKAIKLYLYNFDNENSIIMLACLNIYFNYTFHSHNNTVCIQLFSEIKYNIYGLIKIF